MKARYVIVIIIALSLQSCDVIWGTTNPVKVAQGIELQIEAETARLNADAEREKVVELNALEIEAAQAAKDEQIAAQKISIWTGEYMKSIQIASFAFFLIISSFSLSIAALGFGIGFFRKAQIQAELIYPHKVTGMLPLQIKAVGGGKVFAIDHQTGSVLRLDVTSEGDRQRIQGALALQQTFIQAAAAVRGRNLKLGAGGFEGVASIQPEFVPYPQELELKVTELLETTKGN